MKLRVAFSVIAFAAICTLALVAPFGYWPWPHIPVDFRLPLLGFFTNLALVAITCIYVIITREQLRELQASREPVAILHARVPDINREDIKYGRGKNQFREGPPIYIDVWNGSGPTIMVLKVTVAVKGCGSSDVLEPQVLVESGKVAPINVAYALMRLVSTRYSKNFIDFPTETEAEAKFMVDYFSFKGKQSVQAEYNFHFYVTEEYINTKIVGPETRAAAKGV